MTSLKSRLLRGVLVGSTTVLVVSSLILFALIHRALQSEFDDSLVLRARSLATLVEHDEDGIDFELTESQGFDRKSFPLGEHFRITRSDGAAIAETPLFEKQPPERPADVSRSPIFQTTTIGEHEPMRLVWMILSPRDEFPEGMEHETEQIEVVVGRDLAPLLATLAQVRTVLIIVCITTLALSCAVLIVSVRRSLRPVDELANQLAAVDASDLNSRIRVDELPEELVPVRDRLNELLDRLEASFLRERRFTGDVAHELRTPLAGLRLKLELALTRSRTPEEYQAVVRDGLDINHHMQRMVESLLHLARADAGQLVVRSAPVDVSQLLRDVWAKLAGDALDRGLKITWAVDSPAFIVSDQEWLSHILQNVLDNAVSHSTKRGEIHVSVRRDSAALIVEVSNSCDSLTADQVVHVFDRFWRGDSSFPLVGESHCGLGLALSKAAVERLGGSIEARLKQTGWFSIELRLPHDAGEFAPTQISTAALVPDAGKSLVIAGNPATTPV